MADAASSVLDPEIEPSAPPLFSHEQLESHAQALASEVSKGRGEWDSADIISFYDELAGYPAPKALADEK